MKATSIAAALLIAHCTSSGQDPPVTLRLAPKRLTSVTLNDGAQACVLIDKKYGDNLMKLFDASSHGRSLREAGFGDDLAVCAGVDSHGVLPVYQDRQITRLGSDR